MSGYRLSPPLVLALAIAAAGMLAACTPYDLLQVLDGPKGKALSISPDTPSTLPLGTVAFSADGGVPPYVFTMPSGVGTLDTASAVYTAPYAAGTAVIRVTDKTGALKEATVTVGPFVGLAISPAIPTVSVLENVHFSAAGGVPPYVFSMVSGVGTFDATTAIYSAPNGVGTAVIRVTDKGNATQDATVTVVPFAPLAIRPSTATVTVQGSITFSAEGGAPPTFTFAIQAPAGSGSPSINATTGVYTPGSTPGTDIVTLTDSEGTTVTATVTVTPLSVVDYTVSAVVFPATGKVSTAIPAGQGFTIRNVGTLAGTQPIDWSVYLSVASSLGSGDQLLASGSVTPNLGAAATTAVALTGTFPAVAPGSYFIIARISSAEDTSPSNNTSAASALTLSARSIDYTVGSVTVLGSPASAGALSGSFVISNIGTDTGGQDIAWTAHLSADATLQASDPVVQTGSYNLPRLAGGASSSPIAVSGTWPNATATWYLIVEVSAADDVNVANNWAASATTASTTALAPVYSIASVATPTETVAGAAVSGTFVIQNTGTAAGSALVYWSVYASLLNETFDAGDTLIATGSIPGPPIGDTPVPYTGSWPSAAGTYYIIVQAHATGAAPIADAASASATTTL